MRRCNVFVGPGREPRAESPASALQAALSIILLAFCLSCSEPEGSGPGDSGGPGTAEPIAVADLRPIPDPDLSGAEAGVREQIAGGRSAVQTLMESDGDPRALARAMGDLGLLYFTYSFVGAAEVCFANARDLAPGDYRWPYLLGYLFKMEGRLAEAITALERARELAPEDLPSLLRLAKARLEQGETAAAGELFEHALELEPDSAPALDGLGRVAAATGDAATAAGYFEQVIEQQPFATSVHHALGLAYRKLGRMDDARSHLEQGGDAAVQIDDPLLVSLIELGKSAEIYLLRAGQAMDAERWDQAAALYPKALEIDDTDFMVHKAYSFALEKLGDLDSAIAQLNQALQVATTGDEHKDRAERAEIYRVMGGMEVLHGREAAAREHFEKSLELDPERLDARLKLANNLARAGAFEPALSHYDFILERQPENAEILVKRATALINLRRPDDALRAFDQAVAASPDDRQVRLRYAEALDYLGEGAAAAAQRRAAESGQLDAAGRIELLVAEAQRLTSDGRYGPAIESYHEVIELDPENVDAHYQLAALLGHTGRYGDALKELAVVIDAAPRHGRARQDEITALLLLERWGAAREKLNQALRLLPRARHLAHVQARLLASAPDTRVRSGALAVEVATRVFEARREPSSAETLAMALAEAGRFDQAVDLQRQLVDGAEAAGAEREAARLRDMLQAYESGRAWRAASPDDILKVLAE